VVAHHAILGAGGVAVTVNPMCTAAELAHVVDDAGCAAVLVWAETADAARVVAHERGVPVRLLDATVLQPRPGQAPVVSRSPDDLAVLLYTSGTTGRPKGAELTHGSVAAAIGCVVERLGLGEGERIGTALPLFHVYGQIVVMGAAFACGATLSLLRPFDPAAMLRLAVADRLTVLAGVPTMWIDLLHADTEVARADLGGLRIALSGGAPLPAETVRALHERFGATLLEGYGLSEATGVATLCAPGERRRQGSVGRALTGVEIVVIDDDGLFVPAGTIGEITLRGPVLMRGYRGRPEASAEALQDGRLRTGDLGRLDEDGYLWVVGRRKDLVIRGGYNVYPREIEDLLHEHPDVREAAVVGVPDERLGEEVAAVVAPRAGAVLDPAALRQWLAERLAGYKVPRIYRIVDRLPTGSTGKVLKRAIDLADVRERGVHTRRR
jgi:long-chain acyl-CoA synthetase